MARDGAAMSKTVSNTSRRRILDLLDEVARLEAALRAIQKRAQDCRNGKTAVSSDSYHLFEIELEASAALSGAGKGWLPPEVGKRALDAIRDWEEWAATLDTLPPDDVLEWSRWALEELAVLDLLKEE